jgi:hypothetical protein
MNEFHGEVSDVVVEKLDFIDADYVDFVDAIGFEELGFKAVGCWSYDGSVVGLGAVAGDGGAVVAEVDVGFEAGDALAGDTGAFEAADELFGFAGEHGPGDHFDAAWGGAIGHAAMVLGLVVDFQVLIFLVWSSGVFAGVLRKTASSAWFFDGEFVVDAW